MSGEAAPHRRLRLGSPGGEFTAAVDPDGACVSSIVHAATGTEFLLRLPWEDEDWTGVFAFEGSNQEWHRRYAGGWHTLVPHAGDARTVDGVEHPFHGEAAWRRWRVIESSPFSCTLEVVLRTVPLTVRRRVQATATGLAVRQSVANHSGREVAFSWTEHPAFGSALIGPGTTVRIGDDPIEAVFPDEEAPHGGFQTVRAKGRGAVELRNADKGTAAVLHWDPEILPYLYVWQEHRKTTGFPWWGRADTIALEPASRPYESDGGPLGPLTLAGGATLTADFALELTCTNL
ncbi:hypothetical protein [Glycomyces harbinensis]|uniref:Galactose mutarotase n=1 Tax=Glycomyces harbinensis TaxID=58114 RepID=A0A1G7BFN4_9ACTN|nr:hypothetical protein [Glycomyces harbinensis]SDE25570.1 Galactose mutarotase [Glycomyces harbinensis]